MKKITRKLGLLFLTISARKGLTLFLFVCFETVFFAFKNGTNALSVFTFDMGFWSKVKLALSVLFDMQNTFSLFTFLLITIISALQSFVIVLFVSYMKTRNQGLKMERASIVVTSLLALFGSSCAACGGAVIGLLSSFGLIGSSVFLLDSGVILGIVIILLLVTLYRLLKKVENPFVC